MNPNGILDVNAKLIIVVVSIITILIPPIYAWKQTTLALIEEGMFPSTVWRNHLYSTFFSSTRNHSKLNIPLNLVKIPLPTILKKTHTVQSRVTMQSNSRLQYIDAHVLGTNSYAIMQRSVQYCFFNDTGWSVSTGQVVVKVKGCTITDYPKFQLHKIRV